MADKTTDQGSAGPSIKVKRSRSRIYEAPAEETPRDPQPRVTPQEKAKAEPAPQARAEAAPPEPEPSPQPEADTAAGSARRAKGDAIIRRYTAMAMGCGLIPLPLIDTVVLAGLQLLLIRELAGLYGQKFSATRGRALLAALVGGVGSVSLATSVFASLLKALPVVGYPVGAATLPVVGGGATYATGRIFRAHFAGGGSLLDFDPHQHRAGFEQEMQEGRRQAKGMSE